MNRDAFLDELVSAGREELRTPAELAPLRARVDTAVAIAPSSAVGSEVARSALWLITRIALAGGLVAAGDARPVVRELPVRAMQAAIVADPIAIEPPAQESVEVAAVDVLERTPPQHASAEEQTTAPASRARRRNAQPIDTETRESASPSVAPQPDPSLGVMLLRRARQSLASDPAAALALVSEHESTHGPLLAQEREVLRIDALARLGRRAEAREAARVFFERFPASAYAERVRRAIE